MLSSPSIRVTLILSYLSTCTWRPVHSSAINLASGVNSVSAILTPLSRSLELARPLLSSGPSRRSVGPLMTCCAANSEFRVGAGQSFSSRTRDYLAIFCNMHRLLSFLLSSSPPLHFTHGREISEICCNLSRGRCRSLYEGAPANPESQAAHSLFPIPNVCSPHPISSHRHLSERNGEQESPICVDRSLR